MENVIDDRAMLLQAVYAYKHPEAQQAFRRTEQATEADRARIAELEKQVYVPGTMRCAKCELVLQKTVLNVGSGALTAADNAPDTCPNCNVPMWRISERDQRREALALFEREFVARRALVTKLSEVFRRIRGEYDQEADRSNYGSSLQDVAKYLDEIEQEFPEIIAADPQRTGELNPTGGVKWKP